VDGRSRETNNPDAVNHLAKSVVCCSRAFRKEAYVQAESTSPDAHFASSRIRHSATSALPFTHDGPSTDYRLSSTSTARSLDWTYRVGNVR
jgi:hypothetical protein